MCDEDSDGIALLPQVHALVRLYQANDSKIWDDVVTEIHEIMCVLHQVKRGRVVNVIKSHALLGKTCCGAVELNVCRRFVELAKIDKQEGRTCTHLVDRLKVKWGVLVPLFDAGVALYGESQDLLQIIQESLECLGLITALHKTKVNVQEDCIVQWSVLRMSSLRNKVDYHVLTSESKDAYDFETYVTTKKINDVPFSLGGLDIRALEKNWAQHRETQWLEAQAKAKKRNKKPLDLSQSASRRKTSKHLHPVSAMAFENVVRRPSSHTERVSSAPEGPHRGPLKAL